MLELFSNWFFPFTGFHLFIILCYILNKNNFPKTPPVIPLSSFDNNFEIPYYIQNIVQTCPSDTHFSNCKSNLLLYIPWLTDSLSMLQSVWAMCLSQDRAHHYVVSFAPIWGILKYISLQKSCLFFGYLVTILKSPPLRLSWSSKMIWVKKWHCMTFVLS